MSPAPCPLCGAHHEEEAWREGEHRTLRCRACGLVYLSPRPPPQAIAAIYEHDLSQTRARQHIAKTRQPYALAHARFTLDLLAAHTDPGMIVEIGAGGGLFLHEALTRGHRVAAIEPNPIQAAFMREHFGIRCEPGPLGPDSFEGEPVDVVYHCNVLSHLPDPVGALQAMHDRLRPGGLMVIETGNFADMAPRYLSLIARTERFQLPEHLVFYGERSLTTLLNRTGFEPIALHSFSRIPEKRGPRLLAALGLGRWADRLRFFFKYRLGRWFPKRGRPQSLIVVARRR